MLSFVGQRDCQRRKPRKIFQQTLSGAHGSNSALSADTQALFGTLLAGSLYEINSEDEGKTIAALHFVGHTGDVEGKFHQLRQQICRLLVAFPIEHGEHFTNLKLENIQLIRVVSSLLVHRHP